MSEMNFQNCGLSTTARRALFSFNDSPTKAKCWLQKLLAEGGIAKPSPFCDGCENMDECEWDEDDCEIEHTDPEADVIAAINQLTNLETK